MSVSKALMLGSVLVCLSAAVTSASDKVPVRAAARPSLVGHWVSTGCETRDGANGQKFHLKRDFSYTATQGTIDLVFFADEQCTQKNMTIHVEGPYSLGNKSTQAPGATEGDFHFAKAVFTPHNAFFVNLFGKDGVGRCGAQPWVVDGAQDVTATGCSPMGYSLVQCPAEYDVVKVEGDKLFFGARPKDGSAPCEPGKRPTQFQVPLVRAK